MKLIFLDADGTLFHHDGYIPESALKAISKAQENGHKVFLCTGRQLPELYGDLLKPSYDGLITGSGAHVEINKETVLELQFSKEQIISLTNYFVENDIDAIYEGSEGVYVNSKTKEHIKRLADEQCKGLSEEELQKSGIYNIVLYTTLSDNLNDHATNKISFLESKLTYDEIYNHLNDQFDVVPCTFAPFGKQSGEISCPNITKGHGIQIIKKHYKSDTKDIIAIGDNFNDLPMFEVSGISVAMGNAPEGVKEKADYITDSLENDGIYKAFKHFELI